MTGQIVSNTVVSPVIVPEEELAVIPVPVGEMDGGDSLLKRAAQVALYSGMEEAEQFFLREFDTLCDDSSLFIDEWDSSITEGTRNSVLHLAGLVYSGNIIEVEDLIEIGLPKTFNHLYLQARYYERQGCIPALKRIMHALQCVKETALDQDDPQFNKYIFRRALCDEWYFGENGVPAIRDLFLSNPDNSNLLENLRRIVLRRGMNVPSPSILVSAFLNPVYQEDQFRQLCYLTRLADTTQWDAFLEFVRNL